MSASAPASRPWIARLGAALALALAVPAPAAEGAARAAGDRAAPALPSPRRGEGEGGGRARAVPGRPSEGIALAPVKLRAGPARGVVLSVAGGRAYLDAGSRDGLASGQTLVLLRRGAVAARCTVEVVADRGASCRTGDARPGDTFAVGAPRVPARPPVTPLPPPLGEEEQRRRRATLEAAPVSKVEAVATPAPLGPSRAEARLSHLSLLVSGASARHEERLDVRIEGAEVAAGWRLYADASALYRGHSADGARFEPGTQATLEVRELSLARRAEPLALAVGRVRPWNAPGSSVFDGAQAGWRARDGELGIFGGAVPDLSTTAPTTVRSTAGLYGALERGAAGVLLRGEGRVAMVRTPELGTRVEAEALAQAWLGRRYDLSGQVRLGFGGDRTAPAALDAARIDLTARLADPFALTGSFVYVGLLVADPAAPALHAGPARHADLTASYDLSRFVTVRLTGGVAKDLTGGLDRRYAGPELALPRLFGSRGGLSAGWLEEGGWLGGRTLWAQAQGLALRAVRLLARASFTMDDFSGGQEDASTVGLVASASADLGRRFTFRMVGLGRMQVRSATGDAPGGLSVLASLEGRY